MGLRLKYVSLEADENHKTHNTLGLSSKHLVVRRGQPFKIKLLFQDQSLDPVRDTLIFHVSLGDLAVELHSVISKNGCSANWAAWIHPGEIYPRSVVVNICTSCQAPLGLYDLQVHTLNSSGQHVYVIGHFVLLYNPWHPYDTVYIPSEEQREEYVKNDTGILYVGTPHNVIRRPWSFGQYDGEILEICLNLLQISPQHSEHSLRDYVHRSDPVYLSRVVCAMINSEDDRGVLKGNWSGTYGNGVNPSDWTGSVEILKLWAKTHFSPVCYGQCWVFASVMCTVMRVFGIPCRVVTIFNSAHDTNANLVIEEFYTDKGEKLHHSRDSIWNFHLWCECWMSRPDLVQEFDGWQVLDPTPQEKSRGKYCCGPCPVRGIRRRSVNLPYDAPFIYASVNADVLTVMVKNGVMVGRSIDRNRVGSHIYTKRVGSDEPQSLICSYKCVNGTTQSLAVSLQLDRVPVFGEDIMMSVTLTNRGRSPRVLREHVNAQAKEYNGTALHTFWEVHNRLRILPGQVFAIKHQIPHCRYEHVLGGDCLVNAAVVIEDEQTQERALASEEFNVNTPQISIEVTGGDRVLRNQEQMAVISFTNMLGMALTGIVLIVEGSGQTMRREVTFKPTALGIKMLHASVAFKNCQAIIRGFLKVTVTAT
ncbi:protein-glutamine gamma-glutamyltransferase 5-like [Chanos chanos]|uniref:protein-glutamine gamma-glutamyltransferase n=1 Tax=Chanos chanos TaxID=29144 RepID=A0A6J2WE80_CHACN|nr:protein-glutamine gamma-glutamyltransferase 5-like [Chanos chanos]